MGRVQQEMGRNAKERLRKETALALAAGRKDPSPRRMVHVFPDTDRTFYDVSDVWDLLIELAAAAARDGCGSLFVAFPGNHELEEDVDDPANPYLAKRAFVYSVHEDSGRLVPIRPSKDDGSSLSAITEIKGMTCEAGFSIPAMLTTARLAAFELCWLDEKELEALADVVARPRGLEAYLAGVPLEDIVA